MDQPREVIWAVKWFVVSQQYFFWGFSNRNNIFSGL